MPSADAAAIVACQCSATTCQSKHFLGCLSPNAHARVRLAGSFSDQQVNNFSMEVGHKCNGIDRNGRLEHEQHHEEAKGQDEQAQVAKA
jgi:hypothetical protein